MDLVQEYLLRRGRVLDKVNTLLNVGLEALDRNLKKFLLALGSILEHVDRVGSTIGL